jgi:hypothetical protein
MDLICAGMYRSCSTWQYGVSVDLVQRHRGGVALGYVLPSEYRLPADAREWRVLKSHEGHPRYARALRRGVARALYASRDVRDVVVSMMHKQAVGFEAFVRNGGLHQILGYDRFWRMQPGTLCQRYDWLVSAPVNGIREIADFLEIGLAVGEAEELASLHSLEENRKRTQALGEALRARGMDLSVPGNALMYDPQTLLHWNHLRQGRNGTWREELTAGQRAVLGSVAGEWLIREGYATDLEWCEGHDRLGGRERGLLSAGRRAYVTRQATLRYPRLARVVKRWFGISERLHAAPVVREEESGV